MACVGFVKQHNHELLLPHETRLLPCNRVITPEDEEKILLYKGAGLSVRQIIRVMELEKKVEHGGLPFIEKDIRNLFTKVKKMIAPDDAMDLIESMKLSKEENIKFQYAYTIDEDKRLEHLFWRLLKVSIGITSMVMLLYLITLTKLTHMTCLVQYSLA